MIEERQADRLRESSGSSTRRLRDSAQETAGRAGAYVQARMALVSERAHGLAQDADARVADLTGRGIESWLTDMRGYVRQHPFQAVAIAVAIGYVLGKVLAPRA